MIILILLITQIIFPTALCFSPQTKYIYKELINIPQGEKLINKQNNKIINENRIQNEEKIWNIKIPKIGLSADIIDGTSKENLNKYVAHFEESAYVKGNVCLAAHNRGYDVNFFKDLKKLKIGDEIIYQFKKIKLTYIVSKTKIIKDTDVYVIEPTEENKITLITCVENEPEKRRCVQGILKT